MSLPTKPQLKRYAGLFLGAAVLSFGLYNVHSQSSITEGGVLGMTLFLQHWFGISPSLSGVVLDVTCYLVAIRFLGRSFAKYAIAASCCFSLCYWVYEQFPPVLPSLSGRPLLAAVLGGCFVGVGVGLVVRSGGASGGDDALALVIARLTPLKISQAYLFTDLVVLLLSLSYIPLPKIACSLVTVTLSSFIIGRIHGSGKKVLVQQGLEQKPEGPEY